MLLSTRYFKFSAPQFLHLFKKKVNHLLYKINWVDIHKAIKTKLIHKRHC